MSDSIIPAEIRYAWLAKKNQSGPPDVLGLFTSPERAKRVCQESANEYGRDPYDTDEPPCFCGLAGPARTTEEFCPSHGDESKPFPDEPAKEGLAAREESR